MERSAIRELRAPRFEPRIALRSIRATRLCALISPPHCELCRSATRLRCARVPAACGNRSCDRGGDMSEQARKAKGSDLFVAALENEGVERIFGVPGEENLDLVESLRTSSIDLVITRHEQSAAFMAATQGRLTGRPGVCLSTLGPGPLNLATGAAYAHLGAMPMLMITGQKAIKSARQARFQIVDIVGAMRPLTKMTRQVVSAQSIPALVRDAFRVAVEER